MPIPRILRENLQFLCVEVDAQLERLQISLQRPEQGDVSSLLDRGGYVQNLAARVAENCAGQLADAQGDERAILLLRCAETVAQELEDICHQVRACAEQLAEIQDPDCAEPHRCGRMLERVRHAVARVVPAFQDGDSRRALKIGQVGRKLDRLFSRLQAHYIEALRAGRNTEDLVRALFVAHGIERMGNALLNVSEAIVSANLGQPVRLEHYQAMQSSMGGLDGVSDPADMLVDSMALTRSGSTVNGIYRAGHPDEEYLAIFKGGQKRKLKEERSGVESWHALYPGLAPRVMSYEKHGRSAALLIEHLPGLTFEQILIHGSNELLEKAFAALRRTIKSVWKETRHADVVPACFMEQLAARLDAVYKIHPEFDRGTTQLCGYTQRSFASLVEAAAAIEANLRTPAAVHIHGDFNVDNILYDPEGDRIHFIDLHRSRYMDYVQDVSVFMVSNYRLQILDRPLRTRILGLACDFYEVGARQARQIEDSSYSLRMALGLARSFATSTRFILDKSLARNMFLRARFSLERVVAHAGGPAEEFTLPVREVFVG